TDIAKNTTDIAVTKAQTDSNTTAIAKNTTDIAKNASDISDIKTDVAVTKVQVAKNTTDIAKNTTDIAAVKTTADKNTMDIAANKTAIDGVSDRVTKLSDSAVQYEKDPNGIVNKDKVVLAGGANGTQLSNVASAGDYTVAANEKNAVNAGDLNTAVTNVTNDLTNKGLTFTGNSGSNTSKLGTTVEIKGADSNISTTVSGGTISIALAKDISVDKVTAKDVIADKGTIKNITSDNVTVGDVVINKDTGINAGNKVISNVAKGVTPNDAANVGQVDEVAKYLGGGAGYDNITKSFNAPVYEIAGYGSHNDVGSAISALDGKVDDLRVELNQAFYSTNERIDSVEKKSKCRHSCSYGFRISPIYCW
ncbi:hypothetical protein A6M14_06605, partial [Acinetobacter sp. Ac_877]|nr:hypothetical protein [Acinetobacter portensis]